MQVPHWLPVSGIAVRKEAVCGVIGVMVMQLGNAMPREWGK